MNWIIVCPLSLIPAGTRALLGSEGRGEVKQPAVTSVAFRCLPQGRSQTWPFTLMLEMTESQVLQNQL